MKCKCCGYNNTAESIEAQGAGLPRCANCHALLNEQFEAAPAAVVEPVVVVEPQTEVAPVHEVAASETQAVPDAPKPTITEVEAAIANLETQVSSSGS